MQTDGQRANEALGRELPAAPVPTAARRRNKAGSIALAIVGTAIIVSGPLQRLADDPGVGVSTSAAVITGLLVLAAIIASFALSIIALVQIRRSAGTQQGRASAIVALVLSSVIVGAAIVAAVAGVGESNGLARADFEESRRWPQDDDPTVSQRFVDGAYETVIKEPRLPLMSRSFGDAPATATMTFSTSVTVVDDAHGNLLAGVTCWASPSFGYLAAVSQDGQAVILRVYSDQPSDRLTQAQMQPILAQGSTSRLSIECRGGGSGPTDVVASVDGVVVARASDPDGYDGFVGVGLWYASEHPNAILRWADSVGRTS
jgi:hypothetical protein